jgi:hypothetical protein
MPDLISLGNAAALIALLRDPVEAVSIAAMRVLARLHEQNLLAREVWDLTGGQLRRFQEWDIRAASFLPRGDVRAQILSFVESSPRQDIQTAVSVMRAAADAVRPTVHSRATPATDAESDRSAWGPQRWIMEATQREADAEFSRHLINWLFAELVLPDYDEIPIYEGRQLGAESASQVVVSLGHTFKPDIPTLFRVYTAFLRKTTEYWIPWLEHWENEGIDLHYELPPWLGSGEVAASRHIEWTLSRNGMRVLLAGLQRAFSSPSDRERWAAAQLLEWATRFQSEPSPPMYYGGSGPDDVDLSQLFAQRTEDRYPCASFYRAPMFMLRAEREPQRTEPLPPTAVLKEDLGPLSLHFWIDPHKKGIPFSTTHPVISKDNIPYPLTFQISVWSEDIEFSPASGPLILNARGATLHVAFDVKRLPTSPRRALVFIFMIHQGTLVGAFRVAACVGMKPSTAAAAQTFEHAYLASDWFRFQQPPAASALSIFIDKREEGLAVFTLRPNQQPWALLAPSEQDLYASNKDLYRELQSLAREAGEAMKNRQEFKFSAKARRLANLGYTMFGQIFLQAVSSEAANFADEYIRNLHNLPEGSAVTIAPSQNCQNLWLPWGLLYDEDPPYDFFDEPSLRGFWGYRFNLVVRPDMAYATAAPGKVPVRMGVAWYEHPETALLNQALKPIVDMEKLSIKRISVQDHSLPALSDVPFDLVEFFCHGHSNIPGLFSPQELRELREAYLQTFPVGGNELLMAADHTTDSLIDMDGGFITLNKLADVLKSGLPGAPIILLSMCESAQFTSSGTGFVPLFLRRGARAVIGTEGPSLWALSREMDTRIITALLDGRNIGQAFYTTRKELARDHVLALTYTLYGDGNATLVG